MNLLVVAIMVLISSFLGLPWMCLAAVETSVHLDSLKVWSSFDAPGVKSHVVKIREQRLTLFFTGVLVGELRQHHARCGGTLGMDAWTKAGKACRSST